MPLHFVVAPARAPLSSTLGFMGTTTTQGRSTTVISYLAVGFVIALVVGQSLNPAIGPAEETHGIVQGTAFVPADGPAPSKNVWVLLGNGTTVVIIDPATRSLNLRHS
jgi:hypothetical protein